MTSKGNSNGTEGAQFCPYCGSPYIIQYGAGTEYQCQYCEQVFDEREIITDVAKAWGLRLDFRAADVWQTYDEVPDLTYGARGAGRNSL